MTKTAKTVARGAVVKAVPKAKVDAKAAAPAKRKVAVDEDGHLDVSPETKSGTVTRVAPGEIKTLDTFGQGKTIENNPTPPQPAPRVSGSGGRPEGKTIMAVSNQWASRPDDERFVSLQDLYKATKGWADASTNTKLAVRDIDVDATEKGDLLIRAGDMQLTPTHWSFTQLCGKAGVPAEYARRIPADLAALNLQHGLVHSEDDAALYHMPTKVAGHHHGSVTLRAVTGPEYGRILDHEVVAALIKMSEGKVRWKVPGMLENAGGRWSHNPKIEVTKANTTIYGSDRDIFVFLCDDEHPIEIGKLPDGSPDYVFRGLIVRHSELGSSLLIVAVMYLRGVCCNRILWGVEGYEEIALRHTKTAPSKFLLDYKPTLDTYANASTKMFLSGVMEARKTVVAKTDEEAVEFLNERVAFSQGQAKEILELHMTEEGHPARNVWDMTQGITAFARSIPHMDKRYEVEAKARRLLDKLKVAA